MLEMAYRLIILLIILSTVWGCNETSPEDKITEGTVEIITNPKYGAWQMMEEPPVGFKVVQTFGADQEPTEATLSHITDVFTDDSLNVYILDHETNKLLSFTPDGELRWASGNEGRGPGDFENARSMAWDGKESIYIGNIHGMRIDRFDMQGNYLETLSVPEDLQKSLHGNKIVDFKDEKLFLFSGLDAEFGGNFHLIEHRDSLHIVNSYEVNLTGNVDVPPGKHEFSSPAIFSDQIIIPDVKSYGLQVYDMDFKKQKVVTRDFSEIIRPGFYSDDQVNVMGTFSAFNEVLKFSSGYYLTSAYWVDGIQDPDQLLGDYLNGKIKGMEYHSTIDLFNSQWELLYSVEAERNINPEIGQPIHIDKKDHLYSFSFDPYPHLKKIKVTIQE